MWEYNRSPENIREELQYAYDKWGTTGWMFSTDTYNDSPKKVKMFHDEFNKMDHKIDFSSYARLDMMLTRPETIKLCYDTGLRSVLFGVETFNQKAGKALGKGMDPVRQQEGLYRIREECPDLIIGVAMIVGLQHDTEEIMRKNNEWFLKPDCPVDAIFSEDELPDDQIEFIEINAELSEVWPNITEEKEKLPEADEFAEIKDKKHLLER